MFSLVFKGCTGLVGLFILVLFSLYIMFPELDLWYFWKPVDYSLSGTKCRKIEDKFQYFYESSGFKMPANAELVLHCDGRGGFHGDGEYYSVLDVQSRQDIDYFLKTVPWDTSWQKGPIPDNIALYTALSDEFPDAFNSSRVLYMIEGTNFGKTLSNARLIVIDPQNNRVFYSEWDT